MNMSGVQSGVVSNPSVALVCLSNLNRSMEAHNLFIKNGIPNVSSFGTGTKVRLPGESVQAPNVCMKMF